MAYIDPAEYDEDGYVHEFRVVLETMTGDVAADRRGRHRGASAPVRADRHGVAEPAVVRRRQQRPWADAEHRGRAGCGRERVAYGSPFELTVADAYTLLLTITGAQMGSALGCRANLRLEHRWIPE